MRIKEKRHTTERTRISLDRGMSSLGGFLHIHAPAGDSPAPHAGIGGSLLLPLGLLTAWSGGGAFALAKALPYLPERVMWAIQNGPAMELRLAAGFGLVAFSAYCLVSFLRKRRAVPTLMVIFFLLMIAISAAVALWHPLHPVVFATVFAVLSAAMIVYFLTSRRVKNTFVR